MIDAMQASRTDRHVRNVALSIHWTPRRS